MTAPIVIYRALSPSGRAYIGQTSRPLEIRKSEHISRARKGKHQNPFFAAALLKYGEAMKWDVLCRVRQDRANDAEERAIDENKALEPDGYNLQYGGGVKPKTAATRRRMSVAATRRFANPAERERAAHNAPKSRPELRGRPTWNKGKKCPQISAGLRGKTKGRKLPPRSPQHTENHRRALLANKSRKILRGGAHPNYKHGKYAVKGD